MDINAMLKLAARFNEIRNADELIEREDFKSCINYCVGETIKDFPSDYEDIIEKKKIFDSRVLSKNVTHLHNLSGTIAVMFNFLAIFNLLEKNSHKNDACLKVYKRMLTIIQEILCLSLSGFPDGTFSRWRSLFENYIIIKLLIQNDEELADRFLKHNVVSRKNLNDAFDKMLNINTMVQDKGLYEEYIKKYGKSFNEDYGWLSEVIPDRKKRTFSNICKIVGDEEKQIPFYKLSCKVLHANSFSSVMYMGQIEDVIPVGPSEHGNVSPIYLSINTVFTTMGFLSEYFYNKSNVGVFLLNYLLLIQQSIAESFS